MVQALHGKMNDAIHRISKKFVHKVFHEAVTQAAKWTHANKKFQDQQMANLLDTLRKELQMELVREFGYLAMEIGAKARDIYATQAKEKTMAEASGQWAHELAEAERIFEELGIFEDPTRPVAGLTRQSAPTFRDLASTMKAVKEFIFPGSTTGGDAT